MIATEIPVLDLGPYLAGTRGARDEAALALRHALEHVGFYFVANHGVPRRLVDEVLGEARRFHALPLEDKLALGMSKHNTGYVPLGGGVSKASSIAAVKKPNLNAAFFIKRDRPPDHPDVVNDVPFRGLNQWPRNLPGFREKVLEYAAVMEALAQRLVPLYALALDLPDDFLAEAFTDPQFTLRLSHYPPVPHEDEQFGLAPHTDSGFMTLLPDNEVEGLSIRPAGADWIDVPRVRGAFLVNSGDILRRWTNDRFLSTEHRVRASVGRERYAIPFFFDPRTDFVMQCLPTCQGPDNPPRYPPITYERYLAWFMGRNYHGLGDEGRP
jgi:isopenicillin N synthase-like dioxygenase